MKPTEGEAKELGKENVAEKESGKEGEKEKKDETQTPAKRTITNGVVSNSASVAADSGGDVTMGTPTPKGKGKIGNDGGMISPESLEAT